MTEQEEHELQSSENAAGVQLLDGLAGGDGVN